MFTRYRSITDVNFLQILASTHGELLAEKRPTCHMGFPLLERLLSRCRLARTMQISLEGCSDYDGLIVMVDFTRGRRLEWRSTLGSEKR